MNSNKVLRKSRDWLQICLVSSVVLMLQDPPDSCLEGLHKVYICSKESISFLRLSMQMGIDVRRSTHWFQGIFID